MSKLIRDESIFSGSRYINDFVVSIRFGTTAEVRNELGVRRFLLPEFLDNYPTIETYRIHRGDRIDILAAELLGDSRLWWVLAELNPLELDNPEELVPGRVINIPPPDFIAQLS